MKLKDIAEIRSGYQFRGKIEPETHGQYRVIQIKDVSRDHLLSTADLVTVNIDRDPEPYSVGLGDVLFLSRGHRLFATPVTERLTNTIATYYFFVLRPRSDRVQAGYLAWYINQPAVQELLNTAKRGSHMPLVSRADVEAIHIDVPPLDVQRTIVALDDLARHEQRLSDELLSKKRILIEQLCARAASGRAGKDH